MVFQDSLTALSPYYTVGGRSAEPYLKHTGASKKEARARASRDAQASRHPAAARCRVDDYPHQFSGGMRQRAMIAMALACDPELLIADEPTTALDVTVQAQILDLLKDLQQEHGTAIILITHDLGVIADIADDVVVMYGGRVWRAARTASPRRPGIPYTGACSAPSRSCRQPRDVPLADPGHAAVCSTRRAAAASTRAAASRTGARQACRTSSHRCCSAGAAAACHLGAGAAAGDLHRPDPAGRLT